MWFIFTCFSNGDVKVMGKFVATVKAVITRLVFAAHGFLGIWQVTTFKQNYFYWYLSSPILLLFFEGIFTLTIKENQEWKWFCPSVFLYLTSIVPAIWLLELDKVDRRMKAIEDLPLNLTTGAQLKEFNTIIGVQIKLPEISMTTDTWITLIEQFLMLILIIGRWMLPKGDLTRDQLSQLLLVYIGTAADIIEFFDSFKDDKIAGEPVLVLLTLAIWSWSLMQFTVVLTATKSRKSRLTATGPSINRSGDCCTIDVCSIILNITLQDGPFLAFRLLLILHYNIISYMNIFFTCKNTLVILLQIYRLYVVYTEPNKKPTEADDVEVQSNISIISRSDLTFLPRRPRRPSSRQRQNESYRTPRKNSRRNVEEQYQSSDSDGSSHGNIRNSRKSRPSRKDTGYSTASSQTSARNNINNNQSRRSNLSNSREYIDSESRKMIKQKGSRYDRDYRERRQFDDAFSEESDNGEEERRLRNNSRKNREKSINESMRTASDPSSD